MGVKFGASVFAVLDWFNLSAKSFCNPLHSVADAQHWNSRGKDCGIAFRRIFVINGTWPTRKNYACGLIGANVGDIRGARKNGAEDLLFADAAGNQLRVLTAKIEDHHPAEFRFWFGVFFLHLYPCLGTRQSFGHRRFSPSRRNLGDHKIQ